ncbi:MAG: ABC transporter permease subunit [Ruminococcaceae bacterium]|nr:ABC transporter permease subunit [Oscillospiraceae bacterium]MBQ3215423.1 ABC transporter permease subunit [Oscillospiraceae bacterium]
MAKKTNGSIKAQRFTMDIIVHTILIIMCVIWVLPFLYLIVQSFRGGKYLGMFAESFFPTEWSANAFVRLFKETKQINFPQMFMNTFWIACATCVISTFFVLAVSYSLSRVKWKLRKPYMNFAMVVTLFPGFMSMVAVYILLKTMFDLEVHPERIPLALIINYSAGAGFGFHVMKGYMDTIPKALDEAAYLDGATKWQTFTKVTLPLCKPMIVYQVITSFMGPWCDFIFAKLICGVKYEYYTVSIGLQRMITKEFVNGWFTRFCAGSVLVAVPISILFIITQKFYQEAMSGSVKG